MWVLETHATDTVKSGDTPNAMWEKFKISDWGGEWRLLEKESDISAIWSMFAILG